LNSFVVNYFHQIELHFKKKLKLDHYMHFIEDFFHKKRVQNVFLKVALKFEVINVTQYRTVGYKRKANRNFSYDHTLFSI
jgi:hypothetical protein